MQVVRPPHSLSPSQLHSFFKCPRKWAYRSLLKLEGKETEALRFGSELHKEIEGWLKDGKVPNQTTKAGLLASEGIPFLPRPRVAEVEKECVFYLLDVPFYMKIDLTWVAGALHVLDHKTIFSKGYPITVTTFEKDLSGLTERDLGRIVGPLTPEGLKKDPQSLLYSAHEMQRLGAPCSVCTWLYYPKDKCLPFPVRQILTTEDVAQGLLEIYPTARVMFDLRKAQAARGLFTINNVHNIPCNPGACNFVGRGCEHFTLCKIGENNMSNDAQARLAALQAQLNGGQAQTVNPPQQQMAPQQMQPQQQMVPQQQMAPQQMQPQPQQQMAPQQMQPQQQMVPQQQMAPQQMQPQPQQQMAPQQQEASPANHPDSLEVLAKRLRDLAAVFGFKVTITFEQQ